MATANLEALPAELLDHITTYLPTANSVSALSATSKRLHDFVEADAWQTFNRSRFPSLCPTQTTSQRNLARTLTTLSKAYDRRALIVRYIEPEGDITAWPGRRKTERWTKPRGQTIGFAPKIDVIEDENTRTELLAFSAGAELCLRKKRRRYSDEADVAYLTYRPLSAREGLDDITTLHIVPPRAGETPDEHTIITGTASGNLQLLRLPTDEASSVPISYFTTQGAGIKSSSLLSRRDDTNLLLAGLNDIELAVYSVDPSVAKIGPISQINIRENAAGKSTPPSCQIWSTQFLSSGRIAAGLGPSPEPIHVYTLRPTGIDTNATRRINFGATAGNSPSVYPIVPLPSSSTGSSEGNVFLSGGFDALVRLHDLRTSRDVERTYVDSTDDSAVYSLLPRGQESFLAGASRQSRLKFFDLRLGAKCYSYLDAWSGHTTEHGRTRVKNDWSLFMRQTGGSNWGPARRNHWQQARAAQSSIYSLASSSAASPFVYAGAEAAILEMAFTATLDNHPDLEHFHHWKPIQNGRGTRQDSWRSKEILDLAMVDQTEDLKLYTQKSMFETWRSRQSPLAHTNEFPKTECLDERWKVGS